MEQFHNHLDTKNSNSMSNVASLSNNKSQSLANHSLIKVLRNSNTDQSGHHDSYDHTSSMLSQSSASTVRTSGADLDLRQSMFNAIKSISNSASIIVSSMNIKTSKDAASIISSQSTSDSISASVKSFLIKKSTSISIANSNYGHLNKISSLNFSNSLAASSIINSTEASASNIVSSYHNQNQQQSGYLQQLKHDYVRLSDHVSNAVTSVQTSTSISVSSHVQNIINSNLSQVMSLSSNIEQINQNTYQAIDRANTSALEVIRNLKGLSKSQAASRSADDHSEMISQSSQSTSVPNRH